MVEIFGITISSFEQHIALVGFILGVGGRLCWLAKKLYNEHQELKVDVKLLMARLEEKKKDA